jgi:hypothetical protein
MVKNNDFTTQKRKQLLAYHEKIVYFRNNLIKVPLEAIRKIVTPDSNILQIMLPDHLVHEKLEIIILPIGEKEQPEEPTIDISQTSKLTKAEAEAMLAYIEASRKEWQI